jgi:hypothetical protein
MDEDLKRAIEDLHVVSSVRFHDGDETHKAGVYANLRCSAASSHGGCGTKLVGPVQRRAEAAPVAQMTATQISLLPPQQPHKPQARQPLQQGCAGAAQEITGLTT